MNFEELLGLVKINFEELLGQVKKNKIKSYEDILK